MDARSGHDHPETEGGKSPSVFVTWSHSDPNWTFEQANVWQGMVLNFANLLRDNGIDVELDLWHDADPQVDWTRWGPRQIEDSDKVVIALSKAWRDRWTGRNDPTQGAGAVAEANALKGLFNRNQALFQQKVLVAVLPGVTNDTIPSDLHGLQRAVMPSVDEVGIEPMLRLLSQQSNFFRAALGRMRHLPPTRGLTDVSTNVGTANPLDQNTMNVIAHGTGSGNTIAAGTVMGSVTAHTGVRTSSDDQSS